MQSYPPCVYERIAEARRVRLHRLIGERLEANYGKHANGIAAGLAVHFEHGRDYQRAVRYFEQAGKNSIRRNAHVEAINYFTKALELLMTLPDTRERAQNELTLQLALGAPFIATKGYAAQEVGKAYTRARELCQQVGETPQIFSVFLGLCAFYTVRGELQTARELGEQLLRLAEDVQDRSLLLEAHVFGVVLFYSGELMLAQAHLEQRVALYDALQHHSLATLYGGVDPGVHCLSYSFTLLWLLGYPTQALKMSHQTLTLAQELSHPFSLAVALCWVTILYQLRRDERTTQDQAETLIALSEEKEMVAGPTFGIILQGWALAEQGQWEEGSAQIRQGLAAFRAVGREGMQMYVLALLAEAYWRAGQVEEGLDALAEALAMVSKTGERWYEAELYRLKGEVVLQSRVQSHRKRSKNQKIKVEISSQLSVPSPQNLTSSTQEAEAYFLKAIEIAQRQQAKSLELRATTSLARLWQQQGKAKEAHEMLAEVYNWFTEGFDTKDLQEAKALLDSLT